MFYIKVPFEPTFYTLHVYVLGFHVLCLDLEINLHFCHDLFMSFENILCFGCFCAYDIIGQSLAKNLIELLDKYELEKKIITYVKDERFNLNIFYDCNIKINYKM